MTFDTLPRMLRLVTVRFWNCTLAAVFRFCGRLKVTTLPTLATEI